MFIVVAILSLLFTPLKLNPFQYLFSLSYIARFILFISLALLISQKKLPNFNQNLVLIASGSILSILGIFQLIFIPNLSFLAEQGWDPHYFRTVSTFLDPNFLGAYLILTLILLVQSSKFISKKIKIVLFIVVYLALITTFSRSSFVLFITSFLTLAFFKKSLPILFLTILLVFGFGLSYFSYSKLVTKPRNISRTNSAQFRLNSWQQGFQEFLKSPILGVGFNSYRFALDEYHLAPQNQLQAKGSSSNDSSLLFVLATTGVIGLIFYLFFLFTLFKTAFSKIDTNKNISIALIAGLTGLLVNSFFINSLFYPFILIWIVLTLSQLLKD